MDQDRPPIEDLEKFRASRHDGITTRINEAIRICRNIPELSARSGIPVATLRKWAKGTSEPTGSILMAIAHASGLHPHWMLTGTGPKRPGEDPQLESGSDTEFAYIDNLKVEAAAGDGAQADSESINNRMAFRKDWLKQHGLRPEKLCFITARGDSMEPLIRSGDTLLVNVYFHNEGHGLVHGLEPGKRAGKEGIFVLRLDGGLVVKRLQPDLDGGYHIRSDNHEYEPLYKRAEDLVIVGRVEWIGRRL